MENKIKVKNVEACMADRKEKNATMKILSSDDKKMIQVGAGAVVGGIVGTAVAAAVVFPPVLLVAAGVAGSIAVAAAVGGYVSKTTSEQDAANIEDIKPLLKGAAVGGAAGLAVGLIAPVAFPTAIVGALAGGVIGGGVIGGPDKVSSIVDSPIVAGSVSFANSTIQRYKRGSMDYENAHPPKGQPAPVRRGPGD